MQLVLNFRLLLIILIYFVNINESWISKELGILKSLETESEAVITIVEQFKILKKQIDMSHNKDIKDIQYTRSALEAAEKVEDFMERTFQKMTELFNNNVYKQSQEDGDYYYVLVKLRGSNGVMGILKKAKNNMKL